MTSTSTKAAHDIETGTIYVSLWGYDQTNVDFYEVTRATATTVTLRKIAQRRVRTRGDMAETVEPIRGDFRGQPFRRKVHGYMRGGVVINQCAIARPWDGTPRDQTHYA